jgi:hypothetical protein
MLGLHNLVISSSFLEAYRSSLTIQPFDFNKTYKSKSIFCNSWLTYTVLPSPKITFEQLCSSYSFKLRYFPDNETGMQEDTDGILKINGVAMKGTYDCEIKDLEKIQPKSIFLDKNTLMNLLLQKFDYENDNFGMIKKNRTAAISIRDPGFNAEEEILKDQKTNYVLLKIDGLLGNLNRKAREYTMVHFQVSNLTDYKDFFQRLVSLGSRKQLYPLLKKEVPELLDPLAPSSNNRFFREVAASSKRETGSEKRITVNKLPPNNMKWDKPKIIITAQHQQPTNLTSQNDSQTSNAFTLPNRDWQRNKDLGSQPEPTQSISQKVAQNLTSLHVSVKRQQIKSKKLEEEDPLDKLSSIPHNDKVEVATPSMRSGMSIYEPDEELNSPQIRKNSQNMLGLEKNSKILIRSKSGHLEHMEQQEERKPTIKPKVLVER